MPATTKTPAPILGVLLANAPSRKICCADKCMKRLKGVPVLNYVIDRARPQVSQLILNANGDPTRFQDIDCPVVPDVIEGPPSTPTGILTGMEWAKDHIPGCEWIVTLATDSPFIPTDLINHLLTEVAANNADMAYIRCGKQAHPEFGIWPVCLADDLRYALAEDGVKGINRWAKDYQTIEVSYSAELIDPFTDSNFIEGLMAVGSDALH